MRAPADCLHRKPQACTPACPNTTTQALHALQQLSVRGAPASASPQQHLQQLGRRLDLGQEAMVGALGALVSVLRRVSRVEG